MTNFRWIIVALLFFSTTIVYFDRVILGILVPYLTTEIGWIEQEYGYVVFAFQLAYALGPFVVGYLIDRLGTRWEFSLAVVVWSLASLSHAAARSWFGFALARMGLGIGQSANFSRKVTMLGSALLVLPVMLVPFTDSIFVCVGLIAMAAAAHNSWSANIFTVASDLFPQKVVGSVIGFSTTVSSIAAMGTALLIGYVLNEAGTQGYVFPFVIAAFGYLIGILVMHLISPKLDSVSINKKGLIKCCQIS